MRRILIIGAALLALLSPARAVDSTVSAMTAAGAVADADLLYCVQSAADRKCTPVQLATYIFGKVSGSLSCTSGGACTVVTNANLTGDVTSIGNATTYGNVVPAAKGGAGTILGALKGSGAGVVTQAACADLSNGTALCSTTPGTGVATAAAAALSAAGGLTSTIASGTSAMGTSAIASAACATVVTTAATNTATTDVVTASFNGDPTAVTGYIPATTGMLTIIVYPTANNVNFKICNNTASSITPGAITLNWRVAR